MDMNTATLPKKDLKIRPYSTDMENHIVTLLKKGLKARPYSMNREDHIVTPPKKGLNLLPTAFSAFINYGGRGAFWPAPQKTQLG